MTAAVTEQQAVRRMSDFHAVYGDVPSRDAFFHFLQNVYRLYPEDRFHALIKSGCSRFDSDEEIYRHLQLELRTIKPFHSGLTYALPSLFKQKRVIRQQIVQLLRRRTQLRGYMEIGSTGRYVSELRRHVRIEGSIVLLSEVAPGWGLVDIAERGGLAKIGRFVPLADYAPLDMPLAKGSFELVTCCIGLHHCPSDRLGPFLASIADVLAPAGLFVLREHDVRDPKMRSFVALAHAVFNAGLGVPWATNDAELRHFRSADEWISLLAGYGLVHTGERLLQPDDPSNNVLMAFRKETL